jgi:hypothetical protein
MAATGVLNGAVAMPSGHAADFQTFDVTEDMPTADITKYGDTGAYSRSKGSGTRTMVVTCGGYYNGSDPGFGDENVDGASATFTMDTGKTLTGTFLVRRIRAQHNRTGVTIPITFELVNNGNVTATT